MTFRIQYGGSLWVCFIFLYSEEVFQSPYVKKVKVSTDDSQGMDNHDGVKKVPSLEGK